MVTETFIGKWLVASALAGIALLAPIHPLIGITGSLIFLDMVTGAWAAHKRGEKITSRRMGRSVGKMLVYQLAVVSGFVIELGLDGMIPVAKLVMAAITVVEGKSLLENLNTIGNTNIFKALIDRITSQKES